MTGDELELSPVASRDEWREARTELLQREKELTRERDELNAERRRRPMVEIDEEYVFEGPDGRGDSPPMGWLRRHDAYEVAHRVEDDGTR